jgi:rubrerythrin
MDSKKGQLFSMCAKCGYLIENESIDDAFEFSKKCPNCGAVD